MTWIGRDDGEHGQRLDVDFLPVVERVEFRLNERDEDGIRRQGRMNLAKRQFYLGDAIIREQDIPVGVAANSSTP